MDAYIEANYELLAAGIGWDRILADAEAAGDRPDVVALAKSKLSARAKKAPARETTAAAKAEGR